ncbi:SulP family inorganic anion transporter [Pseudogemmatithrix spongiicola]|uniref:SulP family inorganic anion transporter n=1 Tax=Pseudogemmatithrix spongiicola TaxID=3062599 RepID=A0AA49K018_9BACT|nr:SulP family inorganic anion transporter [Gemmatimonadaceae bacterium 'strain 138']WKW15004.1 SulP family inorganic anion transporter [Gemmatimonadaceae bacterium 'strain 318']
MQRTISWRHDVPASIVVFLVAVPLCLGIALASGAPLFSGIIAGIVGGLVVGLISDSQLMVSGPAAGLTAIVLAAITDLGGFEIFLAAVVLAGAMQVAFGLLRAGVIGYYFPTAVIKGMLSAIGLILIMKQIPHAIGYDADAMADDTYMQGTAETAFTGVAEAFRHIQWGAAIIALIALPLLFAWGKGPLKRLKDIPAPLFIVLFGIGMNAAFTAFAPSLAIGPTHLVSVPVPDSLGSFFGQFMFPDWSAMLQPAVWQVALTLAVVASLESLLSLQATDEMDPWHREANTDRELLAQGIGNFTSGLIGGLPVTGVIVRSATNISAGARTRWSGVLHGLWLLVAALAIPGLLNTIPLAALAAVLIHVGYKLANPVLFKAALQRGRTYAFSFFFTVGVILVTDLLRGILVGLAVGVVAILRDHVQSPPYTEVSAPGAVLKRLQLHDNVNFLHKAALATMLEALPEGSRIELDARRTRRLDADVLEVIGNFQRLAPQRNIDLRLVGFPPVAP